MKLKRSPRTEPALLMLYSSNFSERYQRNILEFLCYPRGHIVTLRYQAMHVQPSVQALAESGKDLLITALKKPLRALSVYAESNGDGFRFFPTRFMEILRIHREGTVFYVEAQLGAFCPYGEANFDPGTRNPSGTPFSPLPYTSGVAWDANGVKRADSEVPKYVDGRKGYFFAQGIGGFGGVDTPSAAEDRVLWERTVDVLSSADSMKRSLFFLAQLSTVEKGPLFRRSRFQRLPLKPLNYGLTTRYLAPAAARLELTILSYRSAQADRLVLPQSLTLDLSSEAFSSASHKDLQILNRYNEDRVEIPTKRVLERTPGGIRISRSARPGQSRGAAGDGVAERESPAVRSDGHLVILAPEPFFLVYVYPPKEALGVIVAGAFLAAFLLSLGPDITPSLGRFLSRLGASYFGSWIEAHPGAASGLAKALGAAVTLGTGYLGLRKLPVGK